MLKAWSQVKASAIGGLTLLDHALGRPKQTVNFYSICRLSTITFNNQKKITKVQGPPLGSNWSNACQYLVPVRHRYYDPDKVVLRRYGYKDLVSGWNISFNYYFISFGNFNRSSFLSLQFKWEGPLPRIPTDKLRRLPGYPYAPANNWTEKKALFGQNDYIDILGSPELHPVRIAYNVPYWLRGFKGHEYQVSWNTCKYIFIYILSL